MDRLTAARRFIQAMDLMRLLHQTGRATETDAEYVCHAREAFEYYDSSRRAPKPEFGSVKFS